MVPGEDDRGLAALAQVLARKYVARNPQLRWCYDEILSDAMLGAAQAYARYRPDHGATLAHYAAHRIRGEIADGIRNRSPVSRTQYARGVRPDTMPAQEQTPVPLELLEVLGHLLPDQRAASEFERVDMALLVADLLETLPSRERTVIERLMLRGDSQSQIGRDLGVTGSRVCQIRRKALATLRGQFDEDAAGW